jgi:hypothetical protein
MNKERQYGSFISYRHYLTGFMAAGIYLFQEHRGADSHRAGCGRDFNHHLAATSSVQVILMI